MKPDISFLGMLYFGLASETGFMEFDIARAAKPCQSASRNAVPLCELEL
jgi:hypothetical protein